MRHAENEPSARDRLPPAPGPLPVDGAPATRIIGCCGWSVSGNVQAEFPGPGSHLQRYARRYAGVEISSSFYRHHQHATYARWAASVPSGFRFAVKLPRGVTHERRLAGTMPEIADFLAETAGLGTARGPLLIQLPPSLAFQGRTVVRFLEGLRRRYAGELVCEPRHPTWFTGPVAAVLADFQVARVAADPARVPEAALPGGWPGLRYYRLHGSPLMYRSAYDETYLEALARALCAERTPAWCIFDNTMVQAAQRNALSLGERLNGFIPTLAKGPPGQAPGDGALPPAAAR